MKKLVLALALVLGAAAPAFATWSVIAIDAKTGQVIIASSTCVRQAGLSRAQAERRARSDGRAGGDRARASASPPARPASTTRAKTRCSSTTRSRRARRPPTSSRC